MRSSTVGRFFLVAALAAAFATPPLAALSTYVDTASGPILGFEQSGVATFLGVPYAAPPLGRLRWRAPEPVEPWILPRLATSVGSPCSQLYYGFAIGSEDCLYLNVWSPARQASDRLPVMVWIHGGGDVTGSGDGGPGLDGRSIYDGTGLAKSGPVVVVSFNYRLGPLGFLGHPTLTSEDAGHLTSGNYGHEDQIAALAWVRDNVARFGGDPGNVTIFGESAGGFATTLHLVTPASGGLFHRAIVQSGAAERILTRDEADLQGTALIAALGCADSVDVPACLRFFPATQILSTLPTPPGYLLGPGAVWGPVEDGWVLPRQPLDAIAAGAFHRVPVIVGNTADEGSTFVAVTGAGLSPTDYRTFVETLFPNAAESIFARYPCTDDDCRAFSPPRLLRTPADNAIATVLGRGLFVCPSRRLATALAVQGNPVYFYTFDRAIDSPYWSFDIGAGHAAEISFLFGTAALSRLGRKEKPLSAAMMSYWTTFARRGDPKAKGLPRWSTFAPGKEKRISLDLAITRTGRLAAYDCAFFDAVAPAGGSVVAAR